MQHGGSSLEDVGKGRRRIWVCELRGLMPVDPFASSKISERERWKS